MTEELKIARQDFANEYGENALEIARVCHFLMPSDLDGVWSILKDEGHDVDFEDLENCFPEHNWCLD